MNYFLENPDLVTTFDRLMRWDELVPLVAGKDADVKDTVATWRELLAVAGEYIGTEIAGRAKQVDELGIIRDGGRVETSAPMKANLKGLAELGFVGLSLPEEFGGSGLPVALNSQGVEMIARACPATMVEFGIGFTEPAAMIVRFGTDEQKRRWVPRIVRGEIKGAVAMTEPQAGSDVGNLQTVAREEAGCWRLTGRKQFISAGNGEFVIVLARCVPGSTGLDGLALFIVDRAGDNYIVERAEHKFTIRGSSTCSLVFEGSNAELLGPAGAGWREILTFMNESRIAIGLQGLGIGEAAFEKASRYAAERVQSGRPIREHPMIAELLVGYGVTHVFGQPGGQTVALYDGLNHRKPAITHLLVRDERSAGYAADAFARLTGRPGVCDVTVGPGTTKLRGVLERLGLVSASPSAAPARSPPRGEE